MHAGNAQKPDQPYEEDLCAVCNHRTTLVRRVKLNMQIRVGKQQHREEAHVRGRVYDTHLYRCTTHMYDCGRGVFPSTSMNGSRLGDTPVRYAKTQKGIRGRGKHSSTDPTTREQQKPYPVPEPRRHTSAYELQRLLVLICLLLNSGLMEGQLGLQATIEQKHALFLVITAAKS